MINATVTLDLRKTETLKKSLVNKVIRKAVTKASTPVLQAIKANTKSKKRTGGMTKSLTKKIKTYGQNVVAIIGPRSQYSMSLGTYVRGPRTGQSIIYRPSKIWHIVERGSKRMPGRWMIRNAYQSTKSTYTDSVCADVRAGIEELTK